MTKLSIIPLIRNNTNESIELVGVEEVDNDEGKYWLGWHFIRNNNILDINKWVNKYINTPVVPVIPNIPHKVAPANANTPLDQVINSMFFWTVMGDIKRWGPRLLFVFEEDEDAVVLLVVLRRELIVWLSY